jgi:hypothetical protein
MPPIRASSLVPCAESARWRLRPDADLPPRMVAGQPVPPLVGDREDRLVADHAQSNQPAVCHVLQQIIAQSQTVLRPKHRVQVALS